MECRKVSITFSRALKSDEQRELIACFKGHIQANRKAYLDLFKATWFLKKLGDMVGATQLDAMKTRIDMLFAEKTINGKTTSEFEQNFVLGFDEKTPTQYFFTFLGLSAILGMPQISETMKKYGLGIDQTDKKNTKKIIKSAGLSNVLVEIKPLKSENYGQVP